MEQSSRTATERVRSPRLRSLLSTSSPTNRRGRIARLAVATIGSLVGAVVMRVGHRLFA
jgi:hypothetical protein